MHRYKDLKVWQKAGELVALVYSLTNQFSAKERFGLITQINHSAVSILSNIAEGAGRNSKDNIYITKKIKRKNTH